jgi:hypothetical protein
MLLAPLVAALAFSHLAKCINQIVNRLALFLHCATIAGLRLSIES